MYQQYEYTTHSEIQGRQTPDSEGFGSSTSTSPSPSTEESSFVSAQVNYFSTPYNYQYQTYPNNYDYNFYQSKSFNDSNYYSRNSSLQYYNESYDGYSKPVEKKPFLKFSIDAILGLNCNDKMDKNLTNVNDNINYDDHIDEVKEIKNKKRKSRKSIDNSVVNNKRMRTIFTQEQLDKLEEEFLRQQYMVGSERSYLANSLGLSESQVKIWFQNRRIKWRKNQSGDNKNDEEFLNQSCTNDSIAED